MKIEIQTTCVSDFAIREILRHIERNMTEEEIMEQFKLLQHQASEAKDTLRRSNL